MDTSSSRSTGRPVYSLFEDASQDLTNPVSAMALARMNNSTFLDDGTLVYASTLELIEQVLTPAIHAARSTWHPAGPEYPRIPAHHQRGARPRKLHARYSRRNVRAQLAGRDCRGDGSVARAATGTDRAGSDRRRDAWWPDRIRYAGCGLDRQPTRVALDVRTRLRHSGRRATGGNADRAAPRIWLLDDEQHPVVHDVLRVVRDARISSKTRCCSPSNGTAVQGVRSRWSLPAISGSSPANREIETMLLFKHKSRRCHVHLVASNRLPTVWATRLWLPISPKTPSSLTHLPVRLLLLPSLLAPNETVPACSSTLTRNLR